MGSDAGREAGRQAGGAPAAARAQQPAAWSSGGAHVFRLVLAALCIAPHPRRLLVRRRLGQPLLPLRLAPAAGGWDAGRRRAAQRQGAGGSHRGQAASNACDPPPAAHDRRRCPAKHRNAPACPALPTWPPPPPASPPASWPPPPAGGQGRGGSGGGRRRSGARAPPAQRRRLPARARRPAAGRLLRRLPSPFTTHTHTCTPRPHAVVPCPPGARWHACRACARTRPARAPPR